MKSSNLPGRREALALLATSVLPATTFASPQMPQGPMTKVMVYPRGSASSPLSMNSPLAAHVRSRLQPALAYCGKEGPTARIRECLTLAFGTSVTEEPRPAIYKWVWMIDHWWFVCCEMTSFAIDFADRGTIVVDAEQGTILRS